MPDWLEPGDPGYVPNTGYPGANGPNTPPPWLAGSNSYVPASQGGTYGTPWTPVGNQPGSATAQAAAGTTPGTTTTGTTGTVGPDITLGIDGNVYGYARNWDPAAAGGKGGYTYVYSNLGPASDLNTVSTNSGIPVGQLQPAILQQTQTLQSLQNQGAISQYQPGMSNSQVQQALDNLRNAQQYQAAQAMQGMDPRTFLTYAQEQNAYNTNQTQFQYANMGLFNQSQLANTQNSLANAQYAQQASNVGGLSNLQLQQQANSYGNQAQYYQGQNYNQQSGVGGMTYGQLGLTNQNNQAQQQYNYNQNAQAQSQYMPGLTNQGVSLQSSNAGDAASLQRNQFALGQSQYSGGQNRIAYQQQIQDRQDAYNDAQSSYNLAHQANQNSLNTYNEMQRGLQNANAQSRTTTGLGFAGIQRPQTVGF